MKDDENTVSPDEAAELRASIEKTRANMSGTIGALQDALNPTVLKEKLNEELAAAKEVVKGELNEAKEAVKSQLIEAKDAVKDELLEAKDTFQHEVREQYQHARNVVHDATIGRVEDMAQRAGETMTEVRTTFLDTVKANPIPAALAGFGLAWLFMNRSKSSSQTTRRQGFQREGEYGRGRVLFDGTVVDAYGQRMPGRQGGRQSQSPVGHLAGRVQHAASDAMHAVGEQATHAADYARHQAHDLAGKAGHVAHQAQDQAGEYVDQAGRLVHRVQDGAGQLVHQAQDQAGEIVHYAQDQAGHLAESARSTAYRARATVQSSFEESPLAMGALAMALGAAVGLAFPRTDTEDEWLGETRDQLFERAGELAHDAVGKAQELAHDAVGQAKEVAEQLVTGESEGGEGQQATADEKSSTDRTSSVSAKNGENKAPAQDAAAKPATAAKNDVGNGSRSST